MSDAIRKLLNTAANRLIKNVSRGYIAGPELHDALAVANTLRQRGYHFALGYWDGPGDTPQGTFNCYQAAQQSLANSIGNYVSIKLPAIQYDKTLFTRLKHNATRCHCPMHFDSLAPEQADAILALFREPFSESDGTDLSLTNMGITLPGRWRRSVEDARTFANSSLAVRVVKGQWDDPDEPKRDATRGYLDVIQALAGRQARVRVATHNYELAEASIKILQKAGTPCEMELLYGLPVKQCIPLAQRYKIPVRVYIAYGHAYLPYALSSLRKHPGVILKLMKEMLRVNYMAGFSFLR